MVLIIFRCQMLTSVSHVWRESTREENFPLKEASTQVNCWGWYTAMSVVRRT